MTHYNERFRRIRIMLGEEGFRKLTKAYVTVVGLGAVGSYAVEALARAGVGRLRVIDFDKVTPSNINRQLYALESTLGELKCDVARERILDINPACEVEAVEGFVSAETVAEYISADTDLVVDAVDSVNPKVDLLAYLRTNEISVVCCLGAALRSDPTRVSIAPLDKAHGCPLGSRIRSRLRRRGVPVDFRCIYSAEVLPIPLPMEDVSADERGMERGRARNPLGSLPTITGIFGLVAANEAIKMLTGRE